MPLLHYCEHCQLNHVVVPGPFKGRHIENLLHSRSVAKSQRKKAEEDQNRRWKFACVHLWKNWKPKYPFRCWNNRRNPRIMQMRIRRRKVCSLARANKMFDGSGLKVDGSAWNVFRWQKKTLNSLSIDGVSRKIGHGFLKQKSLKFCCASNSWLYYTYIFLDFVFCFRVILILV